MAGLRVGVVGATGALGSEVLAVLSEAPLHVAEVVPMATDESLGRAIEFQGNEIPVETEAPVLRGLDLLFLCAPAEVSLQFARDALHAEVPCLDASGALASTGEVPLRLAAFGAPARREPTPLLVAPPGEAIPWALALRPLAEAAGLRRVSGTALEGASWGGRAGIEALYQESIALFNQRDAPEPAVFPAPVAFDCLATLGEVEEGGGTVRERALVRSLGRLIAPDLPLAVTLIQVPVFVGFGAAVCVETERPLDPKQAAECLAAAPGLELWPDPAQGPSVRAAAGRDCVLIGRVRRDPTVSQGLMLWLAADVLRLAAANAVQLAVGWLGLHH